MSSLHLSRLFSACSRVGQAALPSPRSGIWQATLPHVRALASATMVIQIRSITVDREHARAVPVAHGPRIHSQSSTTLAKRGTSTAGASANNEIQLPATQRHTSSSSTPLCTNHFQIISKRPHARKPPTPTLRRPLQGSRCPSW